jgi:hypothetical protein
MSDDVPKIYDELLEQVKRLRTAISESAMHLQQEHLDTEDVLNRANIVVGFANRIEALTLFRLWIEREFGVMNTKTEKMDNQIMRRVEFQCRQCGRRCESLMHINDERVINEKCIDCQINDDAHKKESPIVPDESR